MIIKDNDRKIFRFIEENNALTISQCAKIFYTNHKFAYDEARKRLKILEKFKHITHYIFPGTNEYIYCFNNKKIISYHNLMYLNIYAKLIELHTEILTFKKELTFSTDKRCDCYLEVSFNNKFIPIIFEVDLTHNTNIYKYDDIYNTGELQKQYVERFGDEGKNIFPKIIIITYSEQREYDGILKYQLLNFKLDGFLDKVLLDE